MNEFDYEVKQRKDLARQASHRKRGSKSKKCSLPSDGMSHKQWKERNGEIVSVRMNKPMSWEDFKKLSRDTKQLYISTLQDLYEATGADLSVMFGVTSSAVRLYLKRAGVVLKPTRKHSEEHQEAWERFLSGEPEQVPATPAGAEAANEEEPTEYPVEANISEQRPAEPPRKPTMQLDNFVLQFSGEFDPDAIRNSLAMILQKGQRVRIEIRCTNEAMEG